MKHFVLAVTDDRDLVVVDGPLGERFLPCIDADDFGQLQAKLAGVLGIDATLLCLLRLLARDRSQPAFRLVEFHVPAVDQLYAAGFSRLPLGQAGSLAVDDERLHSPLMRRLAEDDSYRDTLLAPWEKPAWRGQVESWLSQNVAAFQRRTFRGVLRKLGSPWNYVASFNVGGMGAPCYFKAVRTWTSYEPELTKRLAHVAPTLIPRVMALDARRGWLVTAGAGELLSESPESPESALREFAKLQIRMIEELRLREASFGELWAQKSAISVGDLADKAWYAYARYCRSIGECPGSDAASGYRELRRRLAERCVAALPPTLVHPDFQPGNVAVETGGDPVFFDWGGATISHPFISLGQFMNCAGLGLSDVGAYLEPWTRFASAEDLDALAAMAPCLKRLDEVVEYAYVYDRVDPHSVMGQFLHADLRTFGRQLTEGTLIV